MGTKPVWNAGVERLLSHGRMRRRKVDGIRALFVGDEFDISKFDDVDIDIDTVKSAKDAMEKLGSAFYDVVVSECATPGVDGVSFLKEVRARYPDIPFILLIDGGVEAAIVEALKGGAEYSVKGRDGGVIFADLSHRIRTMVAERRIWAAHLELDERFWFLLLSLRGMAFTATLDFVPTSICGDVEEITGYTEEEIFSCDPRWDQIIHPDDLSRLKPEMEVARSARTHVSENEYRIIRKDGDVRWVHELVQIVCEAPGFLHKVKGIFYDVTDRKRAELALEDGKKRDQELANLLPLTVFELDSMGRVIFSNQNGLDVFGYSPEDLRRGLTIFDVIVTVDPDELERFFRLALSGVCTNYELPMTRKDGSTFPAIVKTAPIIRDGHLLGLRGIIVDISERMEMARSKGAEIAVAEGWPAVHVDRLRISEELVPPVGNSTKCAGDRTDSRIEVGWRKDGEDVVFFVRDNGIGIDADQQKKVFELFYKAEPDSEGTGAGLAIVKRIIEFHGGRMSIGSEDGEGRTFSFTLPVTGD